MAIKKGDLYSSLWASCDELRGGVFARHSGRTQMQPHRPAYDIIMFGIGGAVVGCII